MDCEQIIKIFKKNCYDAFSTPDARVADVNESNKIKCIILAKEVVLCIKKEYENYQENLPEYTFSTNQKEK